jgi:UDP-N-acetylmuramyl pentapeptide phosphotransferase/UDP-N-acetylglucosamine-1-phosphate transferase
MAISAQLVLLLAAAIISASIIYLLRPVLAHYALAQPNARSSHLEPTPQGGGIAVVAAIIIAIAGAVVFVPHLFRDYHQLAVVLAATAGLAVVGVTDDVRPMEPVPRLILQAVAVAMVVAALPMELRIVSALPWWAERLCFLIGGIWFVNLVNFMDGIDWMTVAEVVPVTAALAAFGLMGTLPHDATVVSLSLCGALIGFAPFNRPVARLFLGDVGSLPIGLLVGWLLIVLASNDHLTAAVLLPLYYLADSNITLLRRLIKGEPILQAHRSHFYQRALDNGLSVYQIVGRVFATNLALATFATLALVSNAPEIQLLSLVSGGVIVSALLWSFGRPHPRGITTLML